MYFFTLYSYCTPIYFGPVHMVDFDAISEIVEKNIHDEMTYNSLYGQFGIANRLYL